jgi:hypothetical protein
MHAGFRCILMGLLFATMSTLAFPQTCVKSESQWEVPEGVKEGDILLMEIPLKMWKSGIFHAAIYKGNNRFYHIAGYNETNNNTDIREWTYKRFCIEPGVIPESFRFYNATDNESLAKNVLKWIEDRANQKPNGARYQYKNETIFPYRKIADPYKTKDIFEPMNTSNRFYCDELVWAAYYSEGIDIDWLGWTPALSENGPLARYASIAYSSKEIAWDGDTTLRNVQHMPFPPKKICNLGSRGNQLWGGGKSITYNEKKVVPFKTYFYKFKLLDIDCDEVYIDIDWGDGANISHFGPALSVNYYLPNNGLIIIPHTYNTPNHTFNVTAYAEDSTGRRSEEALTFKVNTTSPSGSYPEIYTNVDNNKFGGIVCQEINFIKNICSFKDDLQKIYWKYSILNFFLNSGC